MKLKLLIISVLVVIGLVAYQKYSEYSTLKSIDSYESCIVAKGSFTQYSYPPTCITRIGTRFIKKIESMPIPTGIDIPHITERDLNLGWYWGNADQKKLNTPSDWVYSDRGRSSCWHKNNVSCTPTN